MSKNLVETKGPQMKSQYGAYTLRAGLARLYAHAHAPRYPHACTHAQAYTHRPICNTYCFSTKTMVLKMCLNVTLYVHCLSCYLFIYFFTGFEHWHFKHCKRLLRCMWCSFLRTPCYALYMQNVSH